MTLQELYESIGGDYTQAARVLHVEKLIDKHVRKFLKSGIVEAVLEAGKTMDHTALFETTHALKGVSANLGLVGLANLAGEVTENYRPGAVRKYTDEEIAEKLNELEDLYKKTAEAIRQYENA